MESASIGCFSNRRNNHSNDDSEPLALQGFGLRGGVGSPLPGHGHCSCSRAWPNHTPAGAEQAPRGIKENGSQLGRFEIRLAGGGPKWRAKQYPGGGDSREEIIQIEAAIWLQPSNQARNMGRSLLGRIGPTKVCPLRVRGAGPTPGDLSTLFPSSSSALGQLPMRTMRWVDAGPPPSLVGSLSTGAGREKAVHPE